MSTSSAQLATAAGRSPPGTARRAGPAGGAAPRRSAWDRAPRPAGRRRCAAAPGRGRGRRRGRRPPLAGARREQRAQHAHGRGLAGAVRAEEAVDLALVDVEVEPVDRLHSVKCPDQALGGDRGLGPGTRLDCLRLSLARSDHRQVCHHIVLHTVLRLWLLMWTVVSSITHHSTCPRSCGSKVVI